MTMTLDLLLELETRLREEATKEGLDPNRFALNTLKERLSRQPAAPSVPHLSKAESELLQRINEGLPVETWQQYHELVAQCHAETLTPEQHTVLIALSDQVEQDHARRLGFVLELARLRGVSLEAQMQTLGIPQHLHQTAPGLKDQGLSKAKCPSGTKE